MESCLLAVGSPRSAAMRRTSALGEVADGKEHILQLLLAHDAEHVALVLGFIYGFQQVNCAVGLAAQPGIVPGRQVVCTHAARVVEQIVEADVAIAGDAWIGREAVRILGDERVDDELLERLLDVDQVEGNAQLVGHPARVVYAVQATAFVGRGLAGTQLLTTGAS